MATTWIPLASLAYSGRYAASPGWILMKKLVFDGYVRLVIWISTGVAGLDPAEETYM